MTNKKGKNMYMVIAVFNKYALKDVLSDLLEHDVDGATVSDVIGIEGDRNTTDFAEKIKIEIVVEGENKREIAMESIRTNCHDLSSGAGKMWWIAVGGAERIRTGETGIDALTKQKDNEVDNPYQYIDVQDSHGS